MKKFKKMLTALLVTIIAITACACNFGKNNTPYVDEGEPILEATENASTVKMVSNTSEMVGGSGYVDKLLKSKQDMLSSNASKIELYPYNLSKSMHNYNVKNNDIRLEFEDWGWNDSLMQKTQMAFVSQSGPEIITGESQMPGYAKGGALKPFPEELATKIRDKMLPSNYQAMEMDIDGNGTKEIYGVAISTAPVMLVWNKKVIRDTLGADSKYVETAPATWSEFLDVCNQIKSKSKTVFPGGVYSGKTYGGYLRTAPFVYMNGGKLVDENDKPAFNSSKSIEAYEYLQDLAHTNADGIVNSETEDAIYNMFHQGRIAYTVDAFWRHPTSVHEFGMNVGVANIPKPDNAADSEVAKKVMVIGAAYLSVPTYVSNKKTLNAFKVIESFITADVQKAVSDSSLRPCAYKEISEAEGYATSNPDQFNAYKVMRDNICTYLPSFSVNGTQIWGSYGNALARTVAKNATKSQVNGLWQTAHSEAIIAAA